MFETRALRALARYCAKFPHWLLPASAEADSVKAYKDEAKDNHVVNFVL
jgi:hypothetical protein